NKTSNYTYYANDDKINAYYDLPPLLPCFKPIQPYAKRKNESYKAEPDEEINYMSDEESVMSKQGKPFLATIHAQIDVFNREISFGIGEDRVKFDVNRNSYHSNVTLEKVYMAVEKESFNLLEIKDDLFSFESPACLRFEQNTRIHTNNNIETIDSPRNMQETSKRCADYQPDNKRDTSRWHVCKPIRVFYDDGSGEDYGVWPTCNPDLSFCSGYEAVYGKGSLAKKSNLKSSRLIIMWFKFCYKQHLWRNHSCYVVIIDATTESEVTSDNESECDVPVKDEPSPIFTTFLNPLFDCNEDFTSSDDESFSNEDVLMENFKIYSNLLFDDKEINSNKIDLHYFNAKSNLIESFPNRDTLFDSSPKFDYLEEFSGKFMPTSIINEERIKREHKDYISLMEKLLTINSFPRPLKNFHVNTIVESLSPSPIPVEDSDSQREETDLFLDTDDLMPPDSENDDYDSEEDIHFLEEILSNDSIPLFENESSNFDHHDDPSFPRPLLEPPDVEVFFEPDLDVLTTKVVKGISKHYVLMPNILPTLLTFDPLYPVYDTLLSFSSENEGKVFKPGILSYLLVSHQDKITCDFFENPMVMYEGYIPLLDVPYLYFYPP
nr:hypothetical protein [Tanacetum cinerariifolium]